MTWIQIADQRDADALIELNRWFWHEAFIREMHLLSPVYCDGGWSNLYSPSSIRIVVSGQMGCDEPPAVEMLFYKATSISVSTDGFMMAPSAEVLLGHPITWYFNSKQRNRIVAKTLYWRRLEASSLVVGAALGGQYWMDKHGDVQFDECHPPLSLPEEE